MTKSFVLYTVNSTGPSIDPWGTPKFSASMSSSILTKRPRWVKPGQSRRGDTDVVEFHK